jgi:hypothetical protein
MSPHNETLNLAAKMTDSHMGMLAIYSKIIATLTVNAVPHEIVDTNRGAFWFSHFGGCCCIADLDLPSVNA